METTPEMKDMFSVNSLWGQQARGLSQQSQTSVLLSTAGTPGSDTGKKVSEPEPPVP